MAGPAPPTLQISFAGNSILVNLSNTCDDACVGIGLNGDLPGERIVLDIATAVPEPATIALFGLGLLPLVLRRRRTGVEASASFA